MSGAALPVGADWFGVYVHVPWCRRLCTYCDFNVEVNRRPDWQPFAVALDAELATRARRFSGAGPARSIYFGGGTPSLAPASFIAARIAAIREAFGLVPGAEITLEADPGTVDASSLAAFRDAGVTRLSLGWQSVNDTLLRDLGRGHDAAASRQILIDARRAGFDNVSVDIIFAVPGQTLPGLLAEVDEVLGAGPEHISLYGLTYHAGTELERRRLAGRVTPIDEDTEAAMFDALEARLVGAGFAHYEVSNYARPGRQAVHNQLYWRGAAYLGLGPGAHSFWRDGWGSGRRWENRRNPAAYTDGWRRTMTTAAGSAADATGVAAPATDDSPTAPLHVEWSEELDADSLSKERLFLALRTADGIALADLDPSSRERISGAVARGAQAGWLAADPERLRPTPTGMRLADSLALLFF